MDSNVLVSLISGVFSVVSALGAVFLKDYLERRASTATTGVPPAPPPRHAAPEPVPARMPRPAPAGRAASLARPIVIVLASFALGIATRALDVRLPSSTLHYGNLAAVAVLLLAVLVFAVHHGRRGSQLLFQFETLALWMAWASGWSLMLGSIWSDFVGLVLVLWLACAVVGGVIVFVVSRFQRTA